MGRNVGKIPHNYLSNPSRRNIRRRERSKELRQKSRDYLGGQCVRCFSKEDLEFDHIDPNTKSFPISSQFNRGIRWTRIAIELDKCQLLCEKCHKIRHQISKSGKLVMSPELREVAS